MKRVEVVVEREEINSTKFDGVKEWGSAGCLGKGKGGISASVSMSNENEAAVNQELAEIKSNEPIGSFSASETPRTERPQPRTTSQTDTDGTVTTVQGRVQSI